MDSRGSLDHTEEAGINVLLPMGGSGLRFAQEGYKLPKPLVNLGGRPMLFWVLDNLSLKPQDTIWIGLVHNVEKRYRVVSRVRAEYPSLCIRQVDLRFKTRGAAETLFILLQAMSPAELARRTLSIDCHTFYRSDIISEFRRLPSGLGCSFYFEDQGHQPLFSYITLDSQGLITSMKEKEAISSLANTGAYGFSSGAELKQHLVQVVDSNQDDPLAYYVSSIINAMRQQGHHFQGIPAELLWTVNNPSKTCEFLEVLRREPGLWRRPLRFCFDLVNTLVTLPHLPGDWTSVDPVMPLITLVRELKQAGHVIIIHTDIGMAPGADSSSSRGGNLAEVGPLVFQMLKEFEIPYDEIYFGKPSADVYIDDRSYNSLMMDLCKDIGWYSEAQVASDHSMIEARQFNRVVVQNDTVLKSASKAVLEGEIHFYRNMPQDIADLFPKYLDSSIANPPGWCSLNMERVSGVTFTHMLINRCITRGRLTLMMESLCRIHNSQGADNSSMDEAACEDVIYANYEKKVSMRYHKFRDTYKSIMQPEDFSLVNSILSFLRSYERSKRATFTRVLHGDPVFSNILLKGDNNIVFLDMRGALGDRLTLVGDVVYDLAKVYQSLCGYDYILLDHPIINTDHEILTDLQDCFQKFVEQRYPTVKFEDIKMVTASHFFSLIPLHVEAPIDRKMLFWQRCKMCIV